MKSFIKVSEVWVPSASGSELELQAGHYGDSHQLRELSLAKKFPFGAGIPGMAWAVGHPLLTGADSGDFQRSAAALSCGISTVVALPIFAGDYLTGVLVLMLGDEEDQVGAIEVWHCDSKQSYDLKLYAGYFGQLKQFEVSARHTSFRQGTGLPGRAWESGAPVLMKDLGHSHAFVRREGALRAGINTGLSFPVFHDAHQVYVMALLSSLTSPIARQVEIWERDPKGPGLTFSEGESSFGEDLSQRYQRMQIAPREGLLGRALFTGAPALSSDLAADTPVNPDWGLTHAMAIPIVEGGRCRALVVLYN